MARDVLEGIAGATRMIAAFLSPMLRHERSHWGTTAEDMRGPWPGDDEVRDPD